MHLDLNYIGPTFTFFILGYFLGSISWSIIISKLFAKVDIRKKGSGNAGAGNVIRNYGWTLGLTVGILDILKSFFAIVLAFLCKKFAPHNSDGSLGAWNKIIIQFAGLGAVIGHIFPIFFKFKGGKAVATFLGIILAFNWILFIIGFALLLILVVKIKVISLSSLITSPIVLVLQIIYVFIPYINTAPWSNPLTGDGAYFLWNPLIASLVFIILVIAHYPNIKRLIEKKEKKYR